MGISQRPASAAVTHYLTPLHKRLVAARRTVSTNWDLYDTRHAVFRPARMTPDVLEAGYWQAYRDFYQWSSILRGASVKENWTDRLRHIAYAGGWKKFEPLWGWVIRTGRLSGMLPLLEALLAGFSRHAPQAAALQDGSAGVVADINAALPEMAPAESRPGSRQAL